MILLLMMACKGGDAADDTAGCVVSEELCDGLDNDCNGVVDDDAVDAESWFRDNDGDGFGDETDALALCSEASGRVLEGGDCDDSDPAVNPAAEELCDNIDNDCDGETDVDASDAVTTYDDVDGDGYGNDATAWATCEEFSSRVNIGGDCDDAQNGVNPGATEICDGVDNDCLESTSEAGMVSVDLEGVLTDDTAAWSGSASLELAEGRWLVCEGSWTVDVDVVGEVQIHGVGDPALIELSGEDARTVITVRNEGRLELRDLRVTRGSADFAWSGFRAGGAIACDASGGSLTAVGVTLSDSEAELGGGLFTSQCAVEIGDSFIQDNTGQYGGGVFVDQGSVKLQNTDVLDNVASAAGGGIQVEAAIQPARVEMTEVQVTGNTAVTAGGVGVFYAATVDCTGSSSSDAGIWGNTADYGGGVAIRGAGKVAELNGVECDLTGPTDNVGDDVLHLDSGAVTEIGDDASFTCDGVGCI